MKWLSRKAITMCIVYLLAAPHLAVAQNENLPSTEPIQPTAHFTHLTSDDGLAQNTIEAILQDSRGFMWFGTPNGLSRFDGYDFTTFQNDPEDPNSLSGNWIHDLYEDRDGMIWIATEGGGVNKFDPHTEIFTSYLPDPQNPNRIAGDRVLSVFQDSADNFWFLGLGLTGVNKFNPATETFTRYTADRNKPNSYRGGAPRDVDEDTAGNIWMAATDVLAKYDPRTNDFSYYVPSVENGRKEDRLFVVHLDSNGNLWVGGGTGLYQFDIQQETFTRFPGLPPVNDLFEDEAGNFWIASGDGFLVFDPETQEVIRRFHHDSAQLDSLSNDRITRLYQDREGVLWIGTGQSGINVFDPRQSRFAHFRHNPNSLASISGGTLSAVDAPDSNRLWVGIENILDEINLDDNQVTHHPLPEEVSGGINAVFEDRSGIVWVGTNGFELYQFDPVSDQFTRYPLETAISRGTPPKSVIDFYEDKDGFLWLAVNHDGLYRLDPARENIEFYESPVSFMPRSPNPPPAIAPHPPITNLYADRDGNIWVSTLNGFFRFDPQSGAFQPFRAKSTPVGAD